MPNQRSIPVHEETATRLKAFKRMNLLDQKTYDEAVNDLLDQYGFPSHDELDDFYQQRSSFTR